MNLFHLLSEQAVRTPDQAAIIDGRCGRERSLSFRELQATIHTAASQMSAQGIGRDSKVLVLVPMQAELYITLAALWKIGAIALFLDPSAGRKYVSACCERTRPDAVIAIPKARLLWWLHGSIRRIPRKLVWGQHLDGRQASTAPLLTAELPDTHPAILTFTSGSTGQPKGAIRSHGLLHAQYRALRDAIALQSGEIELATMPIIALVNLAAGITTLIPDAELKRPGFVKIEKILKQVARFQPDRCVASPSFLGRFPENSDGITDCFNKIYTGGAPAFPSHLERLQRTFPQARVTVLYGSTEAEPISHIEWTKHRTRSNAMTGLLVGPIAPEADVRIIDDSWGQAIPPQTAAEWDQRALQTPAAGEIVVAGEHVIPGYLDGIGDSENKVDVEGRIWHRTGDAGYFDQDGQLWLLGRCAAKFKLGDQWVYPFAIECAAVEHFHVSIAACCAIRGKPMLFLPKEYTGPIPERFTCGDITIGTVRRTKIPLDKRHNAKVDYARLA